MREAKRERKAITARFERKALHRIAERLPPGVTSDHLTLLGVLGAVGVAAGYALSGLSPHWLWLASAALALNWFGDSLDGTVARVRKTERPRYGYYLDHAVDAITTTIIGIGIGLSPFVSLPVAMVLVILYLIMSINVYLESTVYGVFRMDYGVVGPTEVRIILIGLNTVLVWMVTAGEVAPATIHPWSTLVFAAASAAMLALVLWRFGTNLLDLARAEPLPRGDAVGGGAETGAYAPETGTHAAQAEEEPSEGTSRRERDGPDASTGLPSPAGRSRP